MESLPIEEGTPVEEFTDDQGRVVKVVIVRIVLTKTITKNGEKTETKEPKEVVIYLVGGKPVKPESILVNGQPVQPKKPEEFAPSLTEFITPLEEVPIETVPLDESVPLDQGIPVEEFTDDKGRVVKIIVVRTIVIRTVIKNGEKTVTREPKEEVVYIIDGKPVQPETITVDGKPVEPKKPEEFATLLPEFITPVEQAPVESLPFNENIPFDQGTPVEEFTDDTGRVVRVVIIRTIVTRTVIKNGEKTVTREPKEEVVYIIDGKPVQPESITVDGKPVEPKKPEEFAPSLTEFITPLEEVPIETVPLDESVPLDQGIPVEEFTDDKGRVVKIIVVRTIVIRTVIRNGVKTVTREPKEEVVYIIDGKPVQPETITVDGKPVEPKKPEEFATLLPEFITPVEQAPVESLPFDENVPFDQGTPVEEFTDDTGRVVKVVIIRTIVTRTIIKNGEKTVTREPKEEVVYIIDGKPVQPESITVDGKPVEPKKPEEFAPSLTEFITPLEEVPIETVPLDESVPLDQGIPVEEFTDDKGRVVKIIVVRTIVIRTVIRNGVKTVTREPKEEVVYIIDGKPVQPETITVDGKPVEPKKPEEFATLLPEFITPVEQAPVESLPFDENVPFDQGTPVEEFTDDTGRVVKVVIIRTIVTRTVIKNGEKTVTREPKEEVVYIIDGKPVQPESITVDGKPVEPKKPEEFATLLPEFITPLEEVPIETVPLDESMPLDQGIPVEEFTDDKGRVVKVIVVRTIVIRTVIKNGERTVTREPKEEVVYIIDGKPVEPETITVDGKPVEPKNPEEFATLLPEFITPVEQAPVESLPFDENIPFDQGTPVEEFTDDTGRVVRVVTIRTIVTRTVIKNGEKTVTREPKEEVVYIIDGKPVQPESITVDGKPVEPKKPEEFATLLPEFITPLEEVPIETVPLDESMPLDQGIPVEEFTDDKGRVVKVIVVRTIVIRTVIKNGEKTVTREPKEEVVYIIDGKPVEPETITVDGKPVEPKNPEEFATLLPEFITPVEQAPVESLPFDENVPFDQGTPVEEFTDDTGRVVKVVIIRTIVTRTIIKNGEKTVTREPKEEVVYIIDGKPVQPESITVDGKPVEPKKPEEFAPSLTEFITPLEEVPIETVPLDESVPLDQGIPVEEFTDDKGRVVKVIVVRTIVIRTVIKNGEKTVTREPKEEVVYIIDGKPVEPETITVDGKPVEPKNPEEFATLLPEFITPVEQAPVESLPFDENIPFDQGTPVEEFTDDTGRVVRVVIIRTIVTRTVIKNGEKTVTREPKEEVVYIIDGKPVEPETITVDGKPVEPKKPEEFAPSLTEFITPLEEVPVETVPLDESVPLDQGIPVEEFTDDKGRVVKVIVVRTIVIRTVIRNGEKTVTREPKEEVVYIIDGKPVQPETITVDGKPIEPKKPEDLVPLTEFITPTDQIPVESLPFEQGVPVEEFTDDEGRIVKVIIVRTIVTRTVIRNGEKNLSKEPREEVVYVVDGKPVEPETIILHGKPVERKKPEDLLPSVSEGIIPLEEVPIESLPFDQGVPVEEFTDDEGRVVKVIIVRTIVTRTVIKNGEKTVSKEPKEEVMYIVDGKPVEPQTIILHGKPVEAKTPEELLPTIAEGQRPLEEIPFENIPFDQGTPVEEFTDDKGRVVRVVVVRTIVTRTVIKNGVKTVTREPRDQVVYVIDGKPVQPETITVDGKAIEAKKPEEILPGLQEEIVPMQQAPVESLPFDEIPFEQGTPVEEFTDDKGRVVRVVIIRTIVTRTVIKNGEKTVTREPKEEVVYVIDGRPIEPDNIVVDGKPIVRKAPDEYVVPVEIIPVESMVGEEQVPSEDKPVIDELREFSKVLDENVIDIPVTIEPVEGEPPVTTEERFPGEVRIF